MKKYIIIGLLLSLFVFIALSVKSNSNLKRQSYFLDRYEKELEFFKLKSKADSLLNYNEFDLAMRLFEQMDSITNSQIYSSYATKIFEDRISMSTNYSQLSSDLNKRSRIIKLLKDNKKQLDDSLQIIKHNLELIQEEFDSILVHNSNIVHKIHELNDSINSINTNDTLTIVNADGVIIKYLGEVKDGKADGYGHGIFDNKSFYEGHWKNNLRSGNGKYYWQNGDCYDGEYFNDLRNGYGTYQFSSGEQYIGNWQDDLRHGKGVLLDKEEKLLYKGRWEYNEPSKNR